MTPGPDAKFRGILASNAKAMVNELFRNLLDDWVLLDRENPWLPFVIDVDVMAQLSAMYALH